MGTLSTRGKNAAANAVRSAATHAALFNGSGVEIDGGGYTRLAVTWGTVSNGVASLASTPYEFSVPAGATVAEIRYMEGSSGSDYQGSESVTPEVFGSAGVYRLTSGSLTIADPA